MHTNHLGAMWQRQPLRIVAFKHENKAAVAYHPQANGHHVAVAREHKDAAELDSVGNRVEQECSGVEVPCVAALPVDDNLWHSRSQAQHCSDPDLHDTAGSKFDPACLLFTGTERADFSVTKVCIG